MTKLTDNGVLEDVVAANAGVQQIRGSLVAQVRRDGVHARPPSAFRATGVGVQNRIVRSSFRQCLHCVVRVVTVYGVLVAEDVKVAQNDPSNIRWPVFSIFALCQNESKVLKVRTRLNYNLITN